MKMAYTFYKQGSRILPAVVDVGERTKIVTLSFDGKVLETFKTRRRRLDYAIQDGINKNKFAQHLSNPQATDNCLIYLLSGEIIHLRKSAQNTVYGRGLETSKVENFVENESRTRWGLSSMIPSDKEMCTLCLFDVEYEVVVFNRDRLRLTWDTLQLSHDKDYSFSVDERTATITREDLSSMDLVDAIKYFREYSAKVWRKNLSSVMYFNF